MRLAWLLTLCVLVAVWHVYGDRLLRAASWPALEREAFHDRAPTDGVVRVGTWNLRRLGHGHKRMDRVARLIDDSFDVLALQEVMSRRAVKQLLAELPGWKAEISPRAVGRDNYNEYYAVLYRAPYVAVERSFLAADRADKLMREPFVTCMRVEAFDFCVANVHIIFGKKARQRDRELDALGRMLAALRGRDREKDWILAGDFNRAPGASGWDALHRAGWHFTAAEPTATSLGKRAYSHAYDHILVDRRHTAELESPSRRVDDMVERTCAGDFALCRASISDHAPVVARFRVRGQADDD